MMVIRQNIHRRQSKKLMLKAVLFLLLTWSPLVLWPASERNDTCFSCLKAGIVYCRRGGTVVKPHAFPVEMDRSTWLLIINISILITRIVHHRSIRIQSYCHLQRPKVLRDKSLYPRPSFDHKSQSWKLTWTVRDDASLLKAIEFLLQSQCLEARKCRTDT